MFRISLMALPAVQALFEGARRGLVQKEIGKFAPLLRTENFPLPQQLLDDTPLLQRLELRDRRALRLDAGAIRRLGKNFANHLFAVSPDLPPACFKLPQE
jgi:hypothetical protein